MSETPPTSLVSSWVDLSNELSSGMYGPEVGSSSGGHGTAAGDRHPSSHTSSLRTTPVPFGSDQVIIQWMVDSRTPAYGKVKMFDLRLID